MRISVSDIFSDSTITRTDGEQLRAMLVPHLSDGQVVALDFSGVQVFASPFFNAAVGDLLGQFTPDHLRTHLLIENLTGGGPDILGRVIAEAKRVRDGGDRYRRALESCLDDM